MKISNLYFLIICLFFVACQDKKQESSEKPSAVETETPKEGVEMLSADEYSPIFIAIMKTDKGMARGVKIGDKIDLLNESTLPADTQPDNAKSFTEYFDDTDLNFADILYYKSPENTVAAIAIDVYIERQTAVDSLMSEFNTYFQKKYGKGKAQTKEVTWNLSDGANQLLLQNVSTEKDPGLKIVFSKKGEKLVL